jgi:hypothetical protein
VASLSRASCRLRHCDRVSAATTVTVDPTFVTSRLRMDSGKARLERTSKVSSALVLDRLACCPPGPPLGENRQ